MLLGRPRRQRSSIEALVADINGVWKPSTACCFHATVLPVWGDSSPEIFLKLNGRLVIGCKKRQHFIMLSALKLSTSDTCDIKEETCHSLLFHRSPVQFIHNLGQSTNPVRANAALHVWAVYIYSFQNSIRTSGFMSVLWCFMYSICSDYCGVWDTFIFGDKSIDSNSFTVAAKGNYNHFIASW